MFPLLLLLPGSSSEGRLSPFHEFPFNEGSCGDRGGTAPTMRVDDVEVEGRGGKLSVSFRETPEESSRNTGERITWVNRGFSRGAGRETFIKKRFLESPGSVQ